MIRPPPSSPLFPYTTLFRFVLHYCVSAPAALLGVYLMSAYVFMPMAWSSYARRHPALDDAPRITHTASGIAGDRSEEHTSELQSRSDLVCRLLLEKKKSDKV